MLKSSLTELVRRYFVVGALLPTLSMRANFYSFNASSFFKFYDLSNTPVM
jgi:hypothetical protein